jgi:hypothetical protein
VGKVEQVGDDGGAGRFGPGAPALEEHGAGQVAHDLDGVVDAIDLRQRLGMRDEGRRDAREDAAVGALGDGQQLDHVAEFLGVLEVAGWSFVMPSVWIWPGRTRVRKPSVAMIASL